MITETQSLSLSEYKKLVGQAISESQIQRMCVKWFDFYFPALKLNLFSIPNEGKRTPRNGARMNAQGRRKGAADMFLAVPNLKHGNIVHGIFIEFKKPGEKQSDEQKEFQHSVEKAGYRYELITSLDQFENLMNEYLK